MARKQLFDFNQTCPSINNSIRDFQTTIRNDLDSMLAECCPLWLPCDDRDRFIDNTAKNIYDSLESAFEDVRSTNEDMRDAANEQIAHLMDEIDALNKELQ